MLRAMVRDLLAHKGRVAMTVVAITLGVAFVVATWVVSDSAAETAGGKDVRGDVGVAVRAVDGGADLTTADKDRLAGVPGVARASGLVSGYAGVVGADGKLLGVRPDKAGTGWDSSQRFVLKDGKAPGPGEVAMAEQQAGPSGRRTGDRVRILLADGRAADAVISGLFAYQSVGEPAPVVAFGDPGVLGEQYAQIELTVRPGADAGAVAASAQRLVSRATVATGADLAAQARARAEESAQSTRESLLGFAAVALLAGMFVIANTFAMLVTQRTRQLALLRAIGASRRQVRRAVLLEAGVLGFVGSTLGVAVGIGLGLLGLVTSASAETDISLAVSPAGILVGYAAGLLVTVISAYTSARRAAAVPPVAALRTDGSFATRSLRARSIAGLVTVAAGAVAIGLTLRNDLSTTERVVSMGGGIAIWLGLLVLAPTLADAVLRPVGRLLGRRGGPATRLGVRNSVRDPRRTAATTSSLMVGLALVCAFATLGSSITSMLGASIRATVPATATVVTSPIDRTALGTDVLAKVRSVPGVTSASADRYAFVKVTHNGSTSPTTVSAVEPDGLVKPEIVEGSGDLRGGAVVGENEAAMIGAAIGDRVTLVLDPATSVTTTIVGLHKGMEGRPLFYVDVATVPAKFRDSTVTSVYATGADPAAVRAGVGEAFADRPDVVVTDRDGVIEKAVESFELLMALMYALFGAAIVIAAFGVVNTLALSVMERTREIGVLRAVGASRRLVRGAIRTESVVICTYGGVLGILVGVGFGAVMQHAMMGQSLWEFSVPFGIIAAALAGMVVVGVLAALWPARRAARTDVLAALSL